MMLAKMAKMLLDMPSMMLAKCVNKLSSRQTAQSWVQTLTFYPRHAPEVQAGFTTVQMWPMDIYRVFF